MGSPPAIVDVALRVSFKKIWQVGFATLGFSRQVPHCRGTMFFEAARVCRRGTYTVDKRLSLA